MKKTKHFTFNIRSIKLEFELTLHDSGIWEIYIFKSKVLCVMQGFVIDGVIESTYSHAMVKLFESELMKVAKKHLPKLEKKYHV